MQNFRDSWENPSQRWGGKFLTFGHLGGTSIKGDKDAWYPELWSWLIKTFRLESMLDVGCGVGYAQKFFTDHGLRTYGVDCGQVLQYYKGRGITVAHDLTVEPFLCWGTVSDLVWSCEVAEHIEEKYVDNFLATLSFNCKSGGVLAFSAAPPGCGGYHHVNCQSEEYWIDELQLCGFRLDWELTDKARELCPDKYGRCHNNYFSRSGLIFRKVWK